MCVLLSWGIYSYEHYEELLTCSKKRFEPIHIRQPICKDIEKEWVINEQTKMDEYVWHHELHALALSIHKLFCLTR